MDVLVVSQKAHNLWPSSFGFSSCTIPHTDIQSHSYCKWCIFVSVYRGHNHDILDDCVGCSSACILYKRVIYKQVSCGGKSWIFVSGGDYIGDNVFCDQRYFVFVECCQFEEETNALVAAMSNGALFLATMLECWFIRLYFRVVNLQFSISILWVQRPTCNSEIPNSSTWFKQETTQSSCTAFL